MCAALLVVGMERMSTSLLQDLKDHFRSAGDVVYTDVYNDGTGVVEYSRYEDFKRAQRDLDESKFRSHEVHTHIPIHAHTCIHQVQIAPLPAGGDSLYPSEGSKRFPQSVPLPPLPIPFPVSFSQSVPFQIQIPVVLTGLGSELGWPALLDWPYWYAF